MAVATGTTTNITNGSNGTSGLAAISADGSTVAFQSAATNLVGGQTDTNGQEDIFLYDVETATTTNITNGAVGASYLPALSADGVAVAFESYATNLVSGEVDANGVVSDIFLYDWA